MISTVKMNFLQLKLCNCICDYTYYKIKGGELDNTIVRH